MFESDDSAFPFVAGLIEGDFDEATLEATRLLMLKSAARGRFTYLVDGRGAHRPSGIMRKRIGTVMGTLSEPLRGKHVAQAIVLGNPVLVGVLTAVRWFLPAQVPERHSQTALEALSWLMETVPDLSFPSGASSIAQGLDARRS
ncbi:MAG TPA: hypothetical protein VGO62_16285 [Myxococcota bacterium]|jgi:hypothetical protein